MDPIKSSFIRVRKKHILYLIVITRLRDRSFVEEDPQNQLGRLSWPVRPSHARPRQPLPRQQATRALFHGPLALETTPSQVVDGTTQFLVTRLRIPADPSLIELDLLRWKADWLQIVMGQTILFGAGPAGPHVFCGDRSQRVSSTHAAWNLPPGQGDTGIVPRTQGGEIIILILNLGLHRRL